MNRYSIYRLLDANVNRVCEGLRVAEDICRFIILSDEFTWQYKQLRHRVTRIVRDLDIGKNRFVQFRDSRADIGADRKAITGQPKNSLEDILRANTRRSSEALRVLEESCQLISPKSSALFAELRFELYILEQKTILIFPKNRWENIKLYVLTDEKLSNGRKAESIVRDAIAGGANAIQLRDPELPFKKKLHIGYKIRQLTRENNILFIVNDQPDLAMILDADGIHIGQKDLPISVIRKLIGHDIIIGKSTHNIKEAIQAEKEGADYISIGPIYPTSSKIDAQPVVGLQILKEIKKYVALPVVAIGGINRNNIIKVMESGADTVAVISAIVSAKNIRSESRLLSNIIQQYKNNYR